MSKFEVNSFQVPNALVDELLEHLSGNELKCYLFIVRKTKGWQKKSDEISVSQFIKATKLSNRVVIQCCKKLIEIGLIECKVGYRNTNVYMCKKITSDEKSLVTKTTTTCDEKSQEPMTKSHTQKDTIKDTNTKDNKRNIKENENNFSFSLNRKTKYTNLSKEYKQRLEEEIEKLNGNLSHEDFINSLEAHGYQYVNFLSVYQKWDKKQFSYQGNLNNSKQFLTKSEKNKQAIEERVKYWKQQTRAIHCEVLPCTH